MDADKQAWLAKYATRPSHDNTYLALGAQTADQISAILRDRFGILPKKRTIGYTKPYPSDYDLIPLPPKYRLPEFTKFNGSERSSSIEHVSRYLAQLGMISVSDPLGVRFLSQSLTGPSFGSNTTRKLLKLGLPTWHRSDRSEGKLLKNISSASEWSKTDAIQPILQRRRWSNWHPWV
jgi:hypothetical protein